MTQAMTKSVLLHVGLPKTGTTSIQDLLAAGSAEIEGDGVLFPIVRTDLREAGRAKGIGVGWHRALSMFVAGTPGGLAPGEWEAWQAEFARFSADNRLHSLVLSQEGLFFGGRPERIAALMREIPAEKREIVLVVRPAHPWLTSLYEQFVRSIVRTAEQPGDFHHALSYADQGFEGMIKRLESHVVGATVRVLAFDDLVAGEGLLVNFVRTLGLPERLLARTADVPKTNSGLPQDMVAFLRAVNAAKVPHAEFVSIRGALARAARRRTEPRVRAQIFPDALASQISERYQRDRDFLISRYGVTLKPAVAPAAETPLAFDAAALRVACTPFLTREALAAFDGVAALTPA